jgi:hypothetical protein
MKVNKVAITVLTGVCAGDIFRFDLVDSKCIIIGRSPECDIALQDPLVSRKHVKIERRKDDLFIIDLGSTHGTVHMGFRLEKDIGRKLNDEDEFKVGESIFRVNFSYIAEKEQPKNVLENDTSELKHQNELFIKVKEYFHSLPKRLQIIYGIIALSLILLSGAFLLLPEKQAIPRQRSHIPLTIPQQNVVGYYTRGGSSERSVSYLDKAQFLLPAADLVLEYEIISESPVDVYIDETFIERIEPYTIGWHLREIILRDVLIGKERVLIFNNTNYPLGDGVKTRGRGAPLQQWAIKNLRATTMSRSVTSNLDNKINESLALANRIGTSPGGLFLFLRSIRECVLELLIELNRDAVGFGIALEHGSLDDKRIVEILLDIQNERRGEKTTEMLIRHLDVLVDMTLRIEAELWRRVYSRINQASLAARARNHILAHDNLVSVKTMFPDEADFRWNMAERMYRDNRIVPKKVRDKPDSFRGR